MKYHVIGFTMLLIIVSFVFVGCASPSEPVLEEKTRGVEVLTVSEESFDEVLRYIGNITSEQMVPIQFSQTSMVEAIHVKPGDQVEMGDQIALTSIPQESIEIPLVSPIDGYVVRINKNKNEWGQAEEIFGLVGGESQIATFGMIQDDVARVDESKVFRVEIAAGSKVLRGELLGIDRIPDMASRTYQAKVEVFSLDQFLIGEICEVKIYLDTVTGIWLPIVYVQNDGQDYVYIVNDNQRIERRNLTLHELNDAYVRVEGLEAGERVVVVGNAFVREGQRVTYKEATHE